MFSFSPLDFFLVSFPPLSPVCVSDLLLSVCAGCPRVTQLPPWHCAAVPSPRSGTCLGIQPHSLQSWDTGESLGFRGTPGMQWNSQDTVEPLGCPASPAPYPLPWWHCHSSSLVSPRARLCPVSHPGSGSSEGQGATVSQLGAIIGPDLIREA